MTERTSTAKRKRVPERIIVLIDAAGNISSAGEHDTVADARADAWGPRFRGRCKVVTYVRSTTMVFRGD